MGAGTEIKQYNPFSMQKLESLIARYNTELVAVAFHDLETGREFLLNADEPYHPASTFKVAVMMEVFHQAQEGCFALDDEIEVHNSFTSIADGSQFPVLVEDDSEKSLYERIGEKTGIRELVRLMIVRSSNLATNILIGKIGAAKVNAFLKESDIDGVSVIRGVEDNAAYRLGMNNSATARGLMQMMKLLGEGKIVSKTFSTEMIDICLGLEFNEGIPAGLPKDVRVAHKDGWIAGHYHDFGLIFPPKRKPYALAVMTRGIEKDEDAHACVAEISDFVYKELL